MAMIEQTAETTGFPHTEGPKITLVGTTSDPYSQTFSIRDEDHTLGNALRWIIMKNPEVLFCGYSIPHPSEYSISLRIQTKNISAVEALDKGLNDLVEVCGVIKDKFSAELKK